MLIKTKSILKYLKRSFRIRPFGILFANQLGYLPRGKDICVRLRNGMAFFVRPNSRDLNEVSSVALGSEYPAEIFELLGTGPTVLVDAGAHIGTFAVFACSRHSTCRVIAIEPEPRNCDLLRLNIRENACADRVTVLEAALGPFNGEVALELGDQTDGHSIRLSGAASQRSVLVRSVTLDALIREHCNTGRYGIKMDIEGAEYDVLESARNVVREATFVVLEWHLGAESRSTRWQWLFRYFADLGFAGAILNESSWGGVALWRKQ